MTTSVFYPAKAAPALGFLKSSINDIEVFVEDSAAPNMWVKLLKRFLPIGIKLNSVNTLGSRKNVLAACKADQKDDDRKKIYIIDADFDILKGKPKPKLKHLYRLRTYCVENYLLQEDSFTTLATTFDTNISEINAKATLNFDGWLARNSERLSSLFICYAVSNELNEPEQTVGYSIHQLYIEGANDCNLCPSRTNARIINLYKEVRKINSISDTRVVFNRIKVNAEAASVVIFSSGKDYIVPAVYSLMKRHFGMNVKLDVFKIMLAENINISVDPYLSRRLRKICH